MFNRIALVIAGLMLTVSSVGCCCLGGYGYGAGYGARGCQPCNNGCPPAGGGYYQQGAMYQGADISQQAFSTSSFTQSAYVPTMQSAGMTTTASAIPGAIQGPPVYLNTATVPAASLPLY